MMQSRRSGRVAGMLRWREWAKPKVAASLIAQEQQSTSHLPCWAMGGRKLRSSGQGVGNWGCGGNVVGGPGAPVDSVTLNGDELRTASIDYRQEWKLLEGVWINPPSD